VSSWWAPVDVTTWREHVPEPRGKRPKHWVKDPGGGIWLRKTPPARDPSRPNTARLTEPAIEVLAIELARRIGIETAEIRPAMWNGERGVVSRRFHDADEQHHPGAELLGLPGESGSDLEAKKRRDQGRASATLERVRAKLLELEQQYGVTLLAPFARVLVFDAWIGNGDRHSGNWAIVTGPRGARFSPMYDPTACLGVELTDERAELVTPTESATARYASRCPSGFGGGDDGRTGIPMVEVVGRLGSWPEWHDAVSELRPRLIEATRAARALLDDIPDEWISPARRSFAARVLAYRVTLIS
jgi:hypothetical protein